ARVADRGESRIEVCAPIDQEFDRIVLDQRCAGGAAERLLGQQAQDLGIAGGGEWGSSGHFLSVPAVRTARAACATAGMARRKRATVIANAYNSRPSNVRGVRKPNDILCTGV
ncbi:MAG: hypothetical protein ABI748_05790, partial [Dokdonella sp.]